MIPVFSFRYLKSTGRLMNPAHPFACCLRLRNPVFPLRIILKWIFRKWDGRTYIGLIWLRIMTGGELLLMR